MKKRVTPIERPWYRDRAQFVRSEDERRWRGERETPATVSFEVPKPKDVTPEPLTLPVVSITREELIEMARAVPALPAPEPTPEPPPEPVPVAEKSWWKRLLRL